MKYEDKRNKVDILAKSSEEYISLSYGNIYRKLVFLDSYRFMKESLSQIAESLEPSNFKILKKEFGEDINLLRQKGIYPYEYITSIETLNETALPPIEAFYSTLEREVITEKQYEHAQQVWNM